MEVIEFDTFGDKGMVSKFDEGMNDMKDENYMNVGFGHDVLGHDVGSMFDEKVEVPRFEDDMLAFPLNDMVVKSEQHVLMTNIHAEDDTNFTMYSNPKIMLQSTEIDGSLMIADTACQRQVVGSQWHASQQNHIKPLKVVEFPDACSFSFGPHKGMPSTARYAYPAGLGDAAVAVGISRVDCDAPAWFSRPAFEALSAAPDIGKGVMFYRALNRKTQLFLARGHLAIRIHEWPEEPFDWPMSFSTKQIADVWIPGPTDELCLKTSKLQESCSPVRRPPHAASSCTTSMAEQLVLPPDQLPGDAVRGEAAGHPVCGDVFEAAHQGRHAGHVLPATQTATAMLKTVTAAQMQRSSQTAYAFDPEKCKHPNGLRCYRAGKRMLHICDLCGGRWAEGTGNHKGLIQCVPKLHRRQSLFWAWASQRRTRTRGVLQHGQALAKRLREDREGHRQRPQVSRLVCSSSPRRPRLHSLSAQPEPRHRPDLGDSEALARRVDAAVGVVSTLASAVFDKNLLDPGLQLTHVQKWMMKDIFRKVAVFG